MSEYLNTSVADLKPNKTVKVSVDQALEAPKPTKAAKKIKRGPHGSYAPLLLPIIRDAGAAGIRAKALADAANLKHGACTSWLNNNKMSKHNQAGLVDSIGGGKFVISKIGEGRIGEGKPVEPTV